MPGVLFSTNSHDMDHWKAVALYLAHTEGIYFTLRNHQHFTAFTAPKVLTEQASFLGIANEFELFVFEAQLLRDGSSRTITVGRNLNWFAVVFADGVAEFAAGLIGNATLRQRLGFPKRY